MNDLLLLMLLLPGPMHGYALKKRAGLILGQPELHNNTVYPLLNRFIGQGWVNRKETGGERGQTRQMYSLTPSGRRELVRRLSQFDDRQAHSDQEFHVRVALFELLPPETRQRILAARTQVLAGGEEHLKLLEKAEQLSGFNAEVVRFRRERVEAEMQWIRKLSRLRPRNRR